MNLKQYVRRNYKRLKASGFDCLVYMKLAASKKFKPNKHKKKWLTEAMKESGE